MEPRIVDIQHSNNNRHGHIRPIYSPTPVAPIMHTSHEPRYIWMDFMTDTVAIGTRNCKCIKSERLNIRKLRIEVNNWLWTFDFDSDRIKQFPLCEELQIVCYASYIDFVVLQNWGELYGLLPRESITFVDNVSGESLEGDELNTMWDHIFDGWKRAQKDA